MSSRGFRWVMGVLGTIVVLTALVFGRISAQDVPATPAGTPPAPAVVRSVLAADLPANAPSQEFQLVRLVIQPGTRLVTHIHPGTQLASIEAGVLTYTVLTGEVPVTRAVTGGTPVPVETVRAGQTVQLRPGDAVIEHPSAVHFGENQGSEPVVILLATLLTAGQPAAIPVNDLGTPVG